MLIVWCILSHLFWPAYTIASARVERIVLGLDGAEHGYSSTNYTTSRQTTRLKFGAGPVICPQKPRS